MAELDESAEDFFTRICGYVLKGKGYKTLPAIEARDAAMRKAAFEVAAKLYDRLCERRIAAIPDPFARWREPSDPPDILPEIIAARCLSISYGDSGPKLPDEFCRKCWGDHHIWFGNSWGIEHLGERRFCKCPCHATDGPAIAGLDAIAVKVKGPMLAKQIYKTIAGIYSDAAKKDKP